MGILSAKCPDCWDPLPCGCDAEKAREKSAAAYAANQASHRQEELLREQNELLKRIADSLDKIAK